jgi:hypothetical protein
LAYYLQYISLKEKRKLEKQITTQTKEERKMGEMMKSQGDFDTLVVDGAHTGGYRVFLLPAKHVKEVFEACENALDTVDFLGVGWQLVKGNNIPLNWNRGLNTPGQVIRWIEKIAEDRREYCRERGLTPKGRLNQICQGKISFKNVEGSSWWHGYSIAKARRRI